MGKSRVTGRKVVVYALVIVAMSILLFPYLWMILTSLQREVDVLTVPPFPYKPVEFSSNNYAFVLSYEPFVRGLINSGITALSTAGLVMSAGALAAYALARMKFRGRSALNNFIIVIYMTPVLTMLIPIVVTLKLVGLLDTLPGMVVAHAIYVLPLMTWFLVGIFQTLPPELDEAAQVDGYSRLKAMAKVAIPLTRTGFLLITVFVFVLSWNDLIMSNVIGVINLKMLQPVNLEFVSGSRIFFSQGAAAGVISSIPIVILAIVLQKYIIAGIMRGAIK